MIFEQREIIHKVGKGLHVALEDDVIEVAVDQDKATALRISAQVRTDKVSGPTGNNLLIVTNIHYEKTPMFWDTILYPRTGTHPWQYCEKYVHARLPIKSLEIHFRLTHTNGEAWFKDFKVEKVPQWQDREDVVLAMLGDSSDMGSYIEDSLRLHRHLEMLLQDSFSDKSIAVRNLAESGDSLGNLLESGRLKRELATLAKCDIMIIRYGLNDKAGDVKPEDFKGQLKQTCDEVLARFPDVLIVLATTIPPGATQMDEVTRELAGERNYPLVDVAAFLTEQADLGNSNWHRGPGTQVGLPRSDNPPDNPTGLKGDIHPNIHGSRLIAEEEYRVIAPIINSILHP